MKKRHIGCTAPANDAANSNLKEPTGKMFKMKLNEYQEKAEAFATYQTPEYAFTNLFAEAGEVASKIAKIQRGDKVNLSHYSDLSDAIICNKIIREPILKELGDVLWQLSACCNELDVTLEEVAQMNLDKLGGRKERGTIKGDGDER
jgi:NTP pyrophosphatase (non-canonical NTP hydrolase)